MCRPYSGGKSGTPSSSSSASFTAITPLKLEDLATYVGARDWAEGERCNDELGVPGVVGVVGIPLLSCDRGK